MAFVAAACASAQGNHSSTQTQLTTSQRVALHWTDHRIQRFTHTAWHWDEVLGRPHRRFSYQPGDSKSVAYVRWVLRQRMAVSRRLHHQAVRLMVKRTQFFLADIHRYQEELGTTKATRRLAEAVGAEMRFNQARHLRSELEKKWHNSSLYAAFMCIHRGEGSMTSVSHSNPPYYGGWQQDITFQTKYGLQFYERWGTADHWPAWAQLYTVVKAYRSGRGFYPWPKTAHNCGLI